MSKEWLSKGQNVEWLSEGLNKEWLSRGPIKQREVEDWVRSE